MIKAICLDLDGTLLNSDKVISEATKKCLIALQQRGIKIILASGRTKQRMMPSAIDLRLEEFGGAIIEANGNAYHDLLDQESKEIRRLSKQETSQILDYFKDENLERMIMGKDNIHILLPKGQSKSKYFTKEGDMEGLRNLDFHYIDSIEDIDESINKVCVYEEEDKTAQLVEKLDQLKVPYWYGRTLPTWLEVGPQDASKGAALKLLATKYNILPSEMIAFGDGENDLSMLNYVTYSVAMGNALSSVKELCHNVCNSCDDDGIATYLNKMEELK